MAPTLDLGSFEELHIVRKLRETIRKWWDIEVAFCDPEGFVSDHAKGIVIPPHNDFCRVSLGSKRGFQLCNQAVRDAIRECRESGEEGVHVARSCHLGFPIMVGPIIHDGVFQGALFCGGFLVRETAEAQRPVVVAAARDMDLMPEDPAQAAEGIPVIEARDMEHFKDLMRATIAECLHYADQMADKQRVIADLEAALAERYRFGNIIGKAKAMRRLFALLERVAASDATVLIRGENGTGKELVARGLHHNSDRRAKPLVEVNCSALTDTLLESELFGHVKGAFTGAVRDKKGLVEVADGGALFLDEVGDMSPVMQPKLLRFLQEGTFLPVGETRPREVDVRVLAATNRDLPRMVEEGTFREDLYYRLNVIPVTMPPLRARKDDIPLLVEHFLDKMKRRGKTRGADKRIHPEVMREFLRRDWPGNVRELEAEVERLVVLAGDGSELGPGLLDPVAGGAPGAGPAGGAALDAYRDKGSLEAAVRALERDLIAAGLIQTHWNKTRLARSLGISRTTLIKKIKELGLEEGTQ